MLDFINISVKTKKNNIELSPDFLSKPSKDLMIRGGAFYAIWNENRKTWSTNEYDAYELIDQALMEEASKYNNESVSVRLMRNFSTNKITEWSRYCKILPDNYHELNRKVIFSNDEIKKTDYATFRLSYPLLPQETPAYEKIMSTLYNLEERQKLEWAIGSVISGDSKKIQKFMVLYGAPGTGKSTILNIIQGLLPGYCSEFDAASLGSNSEFGMESIKDNPLVGIQHDGNLSRIENNEKLNSIVAHEKMAVNEKYKSVYKTRFHSFLFMGTNKPVRITDAKSGILRRLIDVTPTGNKIPPSEYDILMDQIEFEKSGIAFRCLEVFNSLGAKYYDRYVAESMLIKTNDFYNFIEDNCDLFLNINPDEGLVLSTAWRRYKDYCADANLQYPMSMRVFKDELKNYFEDYKDRHKGHYSVYFGFREGLFRSTPTEVWEGEKWLTFDVLDSVFDVLFQGCPAQYASKEGAPLTSWDKIKTSLKDISTEKLHYVRVPENLVVIDFDLKNEKGEKDFEKNFIAASKWPATYAELSRSGDGIHLHYYYDGDPSELSRIFAEDVEIKVFTGKSSLRRALTKCNNLPIAHISSGLPLKERRGKMINEVGLKSEKALRELIKRNLKKEIHPGTKPSIDFIHKILEDAYDSGLQYNVTDMAPTIQAFALHSSHQSEYCLRMVAKMKFKSSEVEISKEKEEDGEMPIVIFDCEVYPNLFVVCFKKKGPNEAKIKLINPTPEQIQDLVKFRLVGFNNRKYDNHILYARMMGYSNEQLFKLSQRIVGDQDKDTFFGNAYNLSYTDIYDFLSSQNKMGLKKWEIKLHIHHQECPFPWDQPVEEKDWPTVADYCMNDVVATEKVWDSPEGQADWLAREILAEWADMTVNDTTNTLTTKLIVGNDPHPQKQFIYPDLKQFYPGYEFSKYGIDRKRYKEGSKIIKGKSIYKGKDPGEGGYAIGYEGIYYKVAVLDIASMHPHAIIKLKIFGEEYTLRFKNIVDARIAIKHGDYEFAKMVLPEKLWKYLNDKKQAKKLANAIKTAINSVYGLTSAAFDNKLRDPRNEDNVVAKYGALFMIDLEEEVKKRGATVVHIKTDSIKIANATPEIIQFVMDYGKEYGFTFEHETTYSKMCIVNDAVYIAKYEEPQYNEKTGKNDIWWTATGTQFAVPYVFKTLFSKEPIEFHDLCETKSVTTALYLDYNEKLPQLTKEEEAEYEYLKGHLETTSGDGYQYQRMEELENKVKQAHDYRFVGRIGSFCPMKDGFGGGFLLRKGDGKFDSVNGTKKPDKKTKYRWMEDEMVLKLGLEDQIDRSYYDVLVDKAVETISKYGDFEHFVSDDNLPDWMLVPETENEEIPFPMNEPKVA